MPPRARKTAAKKVEPAVTTDTDSLGTSAENPVDLPIEMTGDDADQPKRRGGRKRSELAHAAREYESADVAVARLEGQYAKVAVRLSEIGAKLSQARATRDESWKVIEAARNARVAPVVDPSLVDDDTADDGGDDESAMEAEYDENDA